MNTAIKKEDGHPLTTCRTTDREVRRDEGLEVNTAIKKEDGHPLTTCTTTDREARPDEGLDMKHSDKEGRRPPPHDRQNHRP